MTEFKIILLNDDFTVAYYSKKSTKDYATLKCKIKKELPDDTEYDSFINAINDFYDNKIDENLPYKIKLNTQNMGFIGFTRVYNCVKCFRNDKTVIINEKILIESTIFIANSKFKYLLDTIFLFLNPTRPVIFKCSDDINDLEKFEKTDIDNTLSELFNW
jgi:hypothetical protein